MLLLPFKHFKKLFPQIPNFKAPVKIPISWLICRAVACVIVSAAGTGLGSGQAAPAAGAFPPLASSAYIFISPLSRYYSASIGGLSACRVGGGFEGPGRFPPAPVSPALRRPSIPHPLPATGVPSLPGFPHSTPLLRSPSTAAAHPLPSPSLPGRHVEPLLLPEPVETG